MTVHAEEFITNENKIYLNVMRKSILTLIIFAFANSIFAQVDNTLLEAQKKAVLDAIIKTDQNVLKTPTKPYPWLERAIAYLDLASFPDSTVSLKDPEASFKALDYISEAIKLDTKDGTKGSIAKEAENLIDGKNKAYNAFVNMGVIKYQGKDYLSSFRYISKASGLAPNDTTSAMYTGVIAQLCQKNEEARKGYEYYISIGGKDVAIIYGLAQIYKVAKEEDAALSMINKGIVIYPSNTDLRNERFNMLISFNRLDEAIKLLEKDINYGGNDFKSMYNLTQLYIMNREDKKAKELQDKIISLYGIDKWEKAIENKDGQWEEEVNITKESSTKQKEEEKNKLTEEKKESPVVAKENITPQKEEKKEDSKLVLKKENVTTIEESNLTLGVDIETIVNNQIELNSLNNEKTKSLIPFKLKNGFYNILNPTNSKIESTSYDEIMPTYFNYLKVRKDKLWGLMNPKGDLIIPIKYKLILDENINYISASSYDRGSGEEIVVTDVFNRKGIKILSKSFNYCCDFDHDFKVYDQYKLKIKNNIILNNFFNNVSGFTIFGQDKKINIRIKPGIEFLTQFNEFNNAIVYDKNENDIKVIDTDNKILLKADYFQEYENSLEYLGENVYSLRDQNGLLALITKSGERLTPYKFKTIRKFKNNRALVKLENNYFEFIDKQGKTIIKLGNEFQDNDIRDFYNNLSANTVNVIDTLGNKITTPNLGNNQKILVETFHSNHFNFRNENYKFGIVSTNGKIIVSPKYDEISDFKYGYAVVKINGKYGIINDSGEEILKVKFNKIYTLHKNQNGDLKYNTEMWDDNKCDFIVLNGLIKVEVSGDSFFVDISGIEFYEK